MKVLSIKAVPTQGQARFRLLVWDGVDQLNAMMAAQANALIENQELVPNSLVKISRYTVNSIGNAQ